MYHNNTTMLTRLHAQDFSEKIQWNTATLIDLRTSHEQMIFWVISEDQTHIDVYQADAMDKIQALKKDVPYYLYCWHGNRSRQIGEYMVEKGFKEVYDLEGGIEAWNKL